jgi:hypothetical protein
MPALILDGKEVSQRSESELSERVGRPESKVRGQNACTGHHLSRCRPRLGHLRQNERQCVPQSWHGISGH